MKIPLVDLKAQYQSIKDEIHQAIANVLLLALPPIFLNTYTAIKQVDPGAVDAALDAKALYDAIRSDDLSVQLKALADVARLGGVAGAVQLQRVINHAAGVPGLDQGQAVAKLAGIASRS